MEEEKKSTRKFKIGDRCTIVKNVLSPECVGELVEIVGFHEKAETFYRVRYIHQPDNQIYGLAHENCLELEEPLTITEEDEKYVTVTLKHLRTALDILAKRNQGVFADGTIMANVEEIMYNIKRLIE